MILQYLNRIRETDVISCDFSKKIPAKSDLNKAEVEFIQNNMDDINVRSSIVTGAGNSIINSKLAIGADDLSRKVGPVSKVIASYPSIVD